MSVKRAIICAIKRVPILLVPICVCVMLATHWALMKQPALVRPLRFSILLTRYRIIVSCIDINECDEEIDGCAQNCTNTAGSYTCSCSTGYRLGSDGHSCYGTL